MKKDILVDSTLEKLLVQSITACAATQDSRERVVARVDSILTQLATYFPQTERIASHCVIEPGSKRIDIDGKAVCVGRLLVQCHGAVDRLAPAMTLIYTPATSDRIELNVFVRGASYTAESSIAWSFEWGWHFPRLGVEVERSAHAEFLRNAFYEAGLFASSNLEIEPMSARAGGSR